MSFLTGIFHIKEKVNDFNFSDEDLSFSADKAVNFMLQKTSMTKDDFDNTIGNQASYKAFTVARLTSLDAIERVKSLMAKTINKGETPVKWYNRITEDEILKKIGFHNEKYYYLETVFRTNVISAYNAGKWHQIQEMKDDISFLEYIAIDDDRTTTVCSKLDGIIKKVDDPFWNTYYPPNHFNCRSQAQPVLKAEAEALNITASRKKKVSLTFKRLFIIGK